MSQSAEIAELRARIAELESTLDRGALATALSVRIAELEDLLDSAIIVPALSIKRVALALGVSPMKAHTLAALYYAGAPLTSRQLDILVPVSDVSHNRADEEFRQLATIRQLIWQIRKQLGRDVIKSKGWTGYSLGAGMKDRLSEILT